MITWFLNFIDEQVARNNSTRELEGGKWVGVFINTILFSQYWMGVWTGYDFVAFGQLSLQWYVKVLGTLMFIVLGFLSAYAYGMTTTHLVAVLFGNLTVKRRRAWGSKLVGMVILGLLIIGIFPYMALIGGIGLLSAVGEIGTMDVGGILVGGIFITIVCVLVPGLLTDPQTVAQKQATILTELLEVASETAQEAIANNPNVAFRMLGLDQQGTFVTNPEDIFTFLKPYPNALRTARGMVKAGYTLQMPSRQEIPPIVYYKDPEPSSSNQQN